MLRFNIIAALSENFGIGIKGDLPWRLKNVLNHFSRTTNKVRDPSKKNAIIMGREAYFRIPESKRPLPERLNIVLTTNPIPSDYPDGVILCKSLEEAMKRLEEDDMRSVIENIWIVGGSAVYKEAMASPRCDRLYLTGIKATYESDEFFPKISVLPSSDYQELPLDDDIPSGVQVENGVLYMHTILKKKPNVKVGCKSKMVFRTYTRF